jgi:hypothetical protein
VRERERERGRERESVCLNMCSQTPENYIKKEAVYTGQQDYSVPSLIKHLKTFGKLFLSKPQFLLLKMGS